MFIRRKVLSILSFDPWSPFTWGRILPAVRVLQNQPVMANIPYVVEFDNDFEGILFYHVKTIKCSENVKLIKDCIFIQ